MLGLGRADYLAEVQRQGLADAAGVAQPQTQAQRLGYELALREREELEGARRGLAAAWGEVEGGEGARLVTCDVRREAGFDAAAPKRISAAEGAAALLEWRGGGHAATVDALLLAGPDAGAPPAGPRRATLDLAADLDLID